MKNKQIKKFICILIVGIMTFTGMTSTALAATNIQDMSHQTGVSTSKTWTIKLNKSLSSKLVNSLNQYVYVTCPRDGVVRVGLSYDEGSKSIKITPPSGGYRTSTTYTIIVKDGLYDSKGKYIDAATVKEFSTINSTENVNSLGTIEPYQLNFSLDTLATKQLNNRPVVIRYFYGNSVTSEKADVMQYMNPDVFSRDSHGIYQFMSLNYIEGITGQDLNNVLQGKGVLSGMGQAFLDGAMSYNINPAYAVSHAMHETGNGTSQLAQGVMYNGTKVYNFFGIGAIDSDPINKGAQKAYEEGWTTPEKAIIGGISWIGRGYINSSYNQNTLYKMKWNANSSGNPEHQYATDVAWAYKQISNIKNIMDNLKGAKIKFYIPSYK